MRPTGIGEVFWVVCQNWFLSDVETEEVEVMGAAVPDADELPLDAITRRETHQVHVKEKQKIS